MKIQKATPNDAAILTNITKKSKAYWGYSNEQIENWSAQLTITKEYLENNQVYKLEVNNLIVGYYSYIILEENIQLDNLFILPNCIGTGLGTFLMNDFLGKIKTLKVKKVLLESEPNAEKFYNKFGFKTIEQIKTSIKDRFLPLMELILEE
jgi:N-acetylglutamate synthase-like GNAT family acetyltransferase